MNTMTDDGPQCCAAPSCCGPGSYCCSHAGPHDHDDEPTHEQVLDAADILNDEMHAVSRGERAFRDLSENEKQERLDMDEAHEAPEPWRVGDRVLSNDQTWDGLGTIEEIQQWWANDTGTKLYVVRQDIPEPTNWDSGTHVVVPGARLRRADSPGRHDLDDVIAELAPELPDWGGRVRDPETGRIVTPSIRHLVKRDLIGYGLTDEQAEAMLDLADELGAQLRITTQEDKA